MELDVGQFRDYKNSIRENRQFWELDFDSQLPLGMKSMGIIPKFVGCTRFWFWFSPLFYKLKAVNDSDSVFWFSN